MSDLETLLARAPFAVRLGTQAIVVDRHDESAFVVCEPVLDPRARILDAEAWVAMANFMAALINKPPIPLTQAAE
ncbi:hypothetical protein [Methylobacterium sp. E-045]|uniref:hypothetical protein n=1 Tax=Methylobacterium sp. E-045 TaxID=2836575 RepID=UPI001FBB5CD0|nr:hypothetical protein [Methylobacterium sp. E-045]MCJ2128342.1 hypothetical protein [Methylobacterium sp. E-045]